MFGVRSIVRLGTAAWHRLRPLPARHSYQVPLRPRLSVEALTDRLVPSVTGTDLTGSTLAQQLASADTQVRFVEIPASGPWQAHVGAETPPISPQQLSNILGGVTNLRQLGTPSVTSGTIEYGGETIPILVLQYGSSVSVELAYSTNGTGSISRPGTAADSQSNVLGGLVNVYVDGSERRFLIDHTDGSVYGPMPPLVLDAFHAPDRVGDVDSISSEPGVPRSGFGALAPSNMSAAMPSSTLAAFIAGWSNGRQIADGLAAPTADGAWVNTVEIAVNAGNPADVLLAVDTVLPDARTDLIRLKDAELAVVPTYLIGDALGIPAALPRADDQPDLGLVPRVVGLDELPGGVPPAPVSIEQLLDLLGAAGTRDVQPGEIEVRDAGFALREWFEGILNQGGSGAVVAALVLEGALVAYVYRRSRRIGYTIQASQILPGRPREKT